MKCRALLSNGGRAAATVRWDGRNRGGEFTRRHRMTRFAAALAGVMIVVAGIAPWCAAQPAKAPIDPAPWVDISKPVLDKLKADGQKFGFAGETAGVTTDAATGDIYMVVNGVGVWKSTDGGKAFERVDGGKVGGRCETGF